MGTGAATGALLGHDNVLEDALTSGAGAVIGECVAESLADREKLAKEAWAESQTPEKPFDRKAYEAAYREKLQPYVDAGRLVAGSVVAATGRDPTLAISAATVALENNFASTIVMPGIQILRSMGFGIGMGLRQSLTISELNSLYEKVGVDGIFLKLVDDGVIRVHKTTSGRTDYFVGDEIFSTPEEAWQAITWDMPFAETITHKEFAKGRTLQDVFGGASFVDQVGALAEHHCHFNYSEKIDSKFNNGTYQEASYHHKNSKGLKSPAPKDGQQALDKSISFKDTSRARVVADHSNQEFVVLNPSNVEATVYHGHVRTWNELTEQMKNALIRAGLVSKKGKIL